jgi:hypothetical protein
MKQFHIQESKPRSESDTSEQFNLFKKGNRMTFSNFIRLPTRLFRTKESPIEMSGLTMRLPYKVTVKLPASKPEVELHPTLAYVLKLISASKSQGIPRPDVLVTGLDMTDWGRCIRLLRAEGALIDSTMKEGRTKQGHMSSRIIHYIYRGWK